MNERRVVGENEPSEAAKAPDAKRPLVFCNEVRRTLLAQPLNPLRPLAFTAAALPRKDEILSANAPLSIA